MPKKPKRELKMIKVHIGGKPYIYWFYFDQKTNERIFNKLEQLKQTA